MQSYTQIPRPFSSWWDYRRRKEAMSSLRSHFIIYRDTVSVRTSTRDVDSQGGPNKLSPAPLVQTVSIIYTNNTIFEQ